MTVNLPGKPERSATGSPHKIYQENLLELYSVTVMKSGHSIWRPCHWNVPRCQLLEYYSFVPIWISSESMVLHLHLDSRNCTALRASWSCIVITPCFLWKHCKNSGVWRPFWNVIRRSTARKKPEHLDRLSLLTDSIRLRATADHLPMRSYITWLTNEEVAGFL